MLVRMLLFMAYGLSKMKLHIKCLYISVVTLYLPIKWLIRSYFIYILIFAQFYNQSSELTTYLGCNEWIFQSKWLFYQLESVGPISVGPRHFRPQDCRILDVFPFVNPRNGCVWKYIDYKPYQLHTMKACTEVYCVSAKFSFLLLSLRFCTLTQRKRCQSYLQTSVFVTKALQATNLKLILFPL